MTVHWTQEVKRRENEWRNRMAAVQSIIRERRSYLAGPKFQGACEDNVATHEVCAMFDRIEAALVGDPMDAYGDIKR